MAARRPFWKWRRWKSIGFCLWPSSICIWHLKLKFRSKLDLCSGNHVYRQTDGRTDKVNPVYPPPTSLGRGIKIYFWNYCHISQGPKSFNILVWTQRVKPGFMHALGNTPTLNLVLRGSLDHRGVSRSVGSQNGADPGSLGLSGAPDTGPWTP